jgi:hypothetical protein
MSRRHHLRSDLVLQLKDAIEHILQEGRNKESKISRKGQISLLGQIRMQIWNEAREGTSTNERLKNVARNTLGDIDNSSKQGINSDFA